MSRYLLHLALFIAVYSTLAAGLNILVGYCGRLALTHVVFFALGAYAYALGTVVLHWGLVASFGLAVLASVVVSACFTFVSHGRHGDEFVLISLALQSVSHSIMANWYDTSRQFGSLRSFFNGPFGVAGLPTPWWLAGSLARMSLFACAVCMGLVLWTGWLLRAQWGRALKAVRDDDWAAQSLGKSPLRLHLQAAAIAAALAAVAGGLYAMYVSYVDPLLCSLDNAVLVLSMAIVGGVGNPRGPLLGAATLVVLPEVLKRLSVPSSEIDSIRLLVYGAALIFVVHFRPLGIAGSQRVG